MNTYTVEIIRTLNYPGVREPGKWSEKILHLPLRYLYMEIVGHKLQEEACEQIYINNDIC